MKVAILGHGVNNQGAYEHWLAKGDDVTIVDENKNVQNIPSGAPTILGANAFDQLKEFDLIIRTPPIRPERIETNGKIWSATNEFFKECPAPIIGVTGTKGKGTTCSLITEILKAAGKAVHLVGNIGVPALEVLPNIQASDIVVFELSSFQLWDLKRSPQIAVVLMIEPDHMDVHASMEEYVNAKANIAKHQTANDLLVYHPTNPYSLQIANTSKAHKKRYMTQEGAFVQNDQIVIATNVICKTTEVGLIGQHNLENICAAVTAAWNYTQDVAAIKQGVTSFKGLPHRLEFVQEINGVTYFDDSFSAAPGAAVAAVGSFTQPEILLCGGFDRGLDFTKFAEQLKAQKNLKQVILMGQTKQKLADAFNKAGLKNYQIMETTDFKEIIKTAQQFSMSGDVVILSPGCPSFDMFKNFKDRGEQFQAIVEQLV